MSSLDDLSASANAAFDAANEALNDGQVEKVSSEMKLSSTEIV